MMRENHRQLFDVLRVDGSRRDQRVSNDGKEFEVIGEGGSDSLPVWAAREEIVAEIYPDPGGNRRQVSRELIVRGVEETLELDGVEPREGEVVVGDVQELQRRRLALEARNECRRK